MVKHDILFIGHITSDILEYQGKRTPFVGGAAFFGPIAARRSGAKVCVVTKMAREDFSLLDQLRNEEIDVIVMSCPRTTSIENIFEADNTGREAVSCGWELQDDAAAGQDASRGVFCGLGLEDPWSLGGGVEITEESE